ncbi:unnamed protein product [Rotaria magnacalcarata]|nr:unnamed protein product [Rotaria magnacalcarata]CAF4271828.1 unnamed protein product [Rotaria magnacalcarata]CAF4773134.1 unnamed protein product [Rotaria magnacalcarata]
MVSLILINVLVVLYFGMFALLIGFTDSIIQVFVLTTVSFYRKALCTFCFIIAAIHECGLFVTAYGSIVVSGFLDNQLARTSAVWCKLRYCLISSLCAASSVCGYLATIDQCLTTSQNVRFRHWSSMKHAHQVSLSRVIIWWLHDTIWLYYQEKSPIT